MRRSRRPGDKRVPDLDLFLADWVLGRSSPEDAVRRAIRALEAGCECDPIAIVAGLDSAHPTREEIETELGRLLPAFDKQLPSPEAALKVLVDDCARRIADGRTEPFQGAWEMFSFSANEDESLWFLDQVRRFIDLC